MKSRLIDRIVAATNCDYLSEVTYPENRLQVLLAAQGLLTEDFDLEEWEYLVSYVTGKKSLFQSREEVSAFLQTAIGDGHRS